MEPAGLLLMLVDLFAWWISQMRDLLQGLWGPARAPDALIIALDHMEGAAPPGGALLLRTGGQERHLRRLDEPGRVLPPGLPVLLRLPANHLLSRELNLPLAAAADLQAVLRFEMDRLTPFDANELFWGIAGKSQDRAQELLRLRLVIIPRALVRAVLDWLAAQNLAPGWIEHEGGRIALNEAASRQRRQPMLTALCAGLALACLAVPFIRQQMALNEAAALVAARTPEARVAQDLRAQLEAAAAGRSAIAAARRQGDALAILAALTKALPDDTWLADLSLKSGLLTMDGQSGNAAKLIALLAAVPGLQDPSFTAPVTRTNDGKADLFSLRAGVAE